MFPSLAATYLSPRRGLGARGFGVSLYTFMDPYRSRYSLP